MLAGAAVRRLAARTATASFPFWVRSVRMDAGIAPREKALGELFLPLWERFASYGEVAHLFGEGRIQLGTRQAGDTIEAARAIAALGVDRGIARFHRHALLTRKGKMQFAASLGSIEVKPRQPKVVEIVESFLTLDSWIWKFRHICDSDKAPATFPVLRRAIDSALFRYCAEGKPEHLLPLIIELGRAETEVALRPGLRKTDKWELQPLPALAAGWANEADDNSPEFAIAAALASINNRMFKTLTDESASVPAESTKKPQADGDEEKERSSFRSSLEPVLLRKGKFVWAESNASASAVWSNRPLAENLAAVLHRQAIEARMENFAHPAIGAARAATLDSIALFLDKQLDERRIENLVRGMSLLDWRGTEAKLPEKYKAQEDEIPVRLPRAYALLKMLFLPNGKLSFSPDREPYLIKHEPRIVPLLMANRAGDALTIAAQRLHATGLVPLTNTFHFPSDNGARLAAALLIPINQRTIRRLARLVLREPEEEV
jgi:CRISPR-associated protein Csx17